MLVHACLFAACHVLCKGICSHCNYRHGFRVRTVKISYSLCCVKPVHDRHHDVHENKVISADLVLREHIYRLLTVPCYVNERFFLLQHILGNSEVDLVVLNKQYSLVFQRNIFSLYLSCRNFIAQFKGKLYCDGSSNTLLAADIDSSVKPVNKLLRYSHSESCSRISCLRSRLLTAERLVNTL